MRVSWGPGVARSSKKMKSRVQWWIYGWVQATSGNTSGKVQLWAKFGPDIVCYTRRLMTRSFRISVRFYDISFSVSISSLRGNKHFLNRNNMLRKKNIEEFGVLQSKRTFGTPERTIVCMILAGASQTLSEQASQSFSCSCFYFSVFFFQMSRFEIDVLSFLSRSWSKKVEGSSSISATTGVQI